MTEQLIFTQNTVPSLLPVPPATYDEDDIEAVIGKALRRAAESKAAQENSGT